jgi:glucose-6-phosphate isomerase
VISEAKIKRLFSLSEKLKQEKLSSLVRERTYSTEACGVFLDYSKNFVTDELLELFEDVAAELKLSDKKQAMFSGEKINNTEGRAVWHTALRRFTISEFQDGIDEMVRAEIERVFEFCDRINEGEIKSVSQKKIKHVINIGIGGSDLGPKMVSNALRQFHKPDTPNVYFVSNIDGRALIRALADSQPEETLFVISSKTFTTQETMENAGSAKRWLLENLTGFSEQEIISNHFCAITTNVQAAEEFGLKKERCFGFWDWVGGRYSLWSAIGIGTILSIGKEHFTDLLRGAASMDRHFLEAPLRENIPEILAFLGVWYNWFWEASSQAIIPYSEDLGYFPSYLQQLDMESNGKGVSKKGSEIMQKTGQVIWGESGTNGQHAFFQLLHQGTHFIPVDFILPAKQRNTFKSHQDILIANALAQSQALMEGKSKESVLTEMKKENLDTNEISELLPHKTFKGNRVSNTLLLEQLNPFSLGALIAAYEHKVFIQGLLYDVNSFDQFGVELGKVLAKNILAGLQGNNINVDNSTEMLLKRIK